MVEDDRIGKQIMEEIHHKKVTSTPDYQRLEAERNALRDDLSRANRSKEDLAKVENNFRTELDALKAEVAELKEVLFSR